MPDVLGRRVRLVAVAAPPRVRVADDLRSLPLDLADMVELRLDLLGPRFDVAAAVAACAKPILATMRSRDQGGGFAGSPRDAATRLLQAVEAGVAWVDVERDVAMRVVSAAAAEGVRVLASFHGRTAVDLPRAGIDAWKVARPVFDGPSLAAALEEARALAAGFREGRHPPAFVVPYGPVGAAARVVTAAAAEAAGIDAFVFGGLAEPGGEDDLPSLPALAHLLDEGRYGEVSGSARLFGLVGSPPARSPSTRLHAAALRAAGVDAIYLPEVTLDADAALALPYAGWSVTTPLKEEAARRCTRLDALSARIGAVNTVLRAEDGGLEGFNTDALAVHEIAGRAARVGGALVLGGGGFARAAAAALRDRGFAVRLAGGARARAAAEDLGVEYAGEALAARPDDTVVVHATPVGAGGPLPRAFQNVVAALPADALVIDGPYETGPSPAAFARAARVRGLAVASGADVLLTQARSQAGIFTGRAIDADVFDVALAPTGNLVLVGPRGAGKTVVGRAVARRLGRPFVDTDDEIVTRAAMPFDEIWKSGGEARFRELEREVVADVCAAPDPLVIASGGGAIVDPDNRRRFRASGVVVWLHAPTPVLAARVGDGATRPLLAGDPAGALARLGAARQDAYESAADAVVETEDRAIDDVADAVLDAYAEHAS